MAHTCPKLTPCLDPPHHVHSLRPHCDRAPFIVNEMLPLRRAFRLFQTMGLRHLCVLDHASCLVGVLTRKDFIHVHHLGHSNLMSTIRRRRAASMRLLEEENRPETPGAPTPVAVDDGPSMTTRRVLSAKLSAKLPGRLVSKLSPDGTPKCSRSWGTKSEREGRDHGGSGRSRGSERGDSARGDGAHDGGNRSRVDPCAPGSSEGPGSLRLSRARIHTSPACAHGGGKMAAKANKAAEPQSIDRKLSSAAGASPEETKQLRRLRVASKDYAPAAPESDAKAPPQAAPPPLQPTLSVELARKGY